MAVTVVEMHGQVASNHHLNQSARKRRTHKSGASMSSDSSLSWFDSGSGGGSSGDSGSGGGSAGAD